ncbi:AAA family ATPase [Flavobacterium jumunjinense]
MVYDLIYNKDKTEIIDSYFLDNESESSLYFPNFNKINIIVGANNSGKSRFMRYLMSNENFKGVNNLDDIGKLIKDYNDEVYEINIKIDEKIKDFKFKSDNTFYVSGLNSDKEKLNLFSVNRLLTINNFGEVLHIINKNKKNILNINDIDIKNNFLSNYNKIKDNFYKEFNGIKRYYIPTLRTAHSLFSDSTKKIEDDIFSHTLDKYYNLKEIDVEVFTGIHLYKDILNSRNSKREIRKKFESFETFISKCFFNGKHVDIVAEFDKDKNLSNNNESEIISVHIDEDEKETRKLYELGDGIQAIIILMYKIFMAEEKSFIYIDEPEINLHPGMQRLFLEQICNNPDLKKKDLTYVISTHSNHFLDLTIEQNNVSIYSFSPRVAENGEKQFVIKNVNAGDNELLRNLGVNNSSVFMANCSIWVEGISDRNYIKAFLKSYCDYHEDKPYPKEDIDFAFFEYAGSNIDHYIFDEKFEKEDENIVIKDIQALAVSNRIFLLADSDATTKTDKSKFERLENLEKAKSDNFTPKICWNIREIENLITNEMWEEVLINFCNKTLVKSNEEIIKEKINVALSVVNSKKYIKKYVGEFLEEVRTKIGKISSKYVLNQSIYEVNKNAKAETSYGTFINKRELSEIVFKQNFSWEVLSKNKEIENLTIEIYNFITNK